MTRKILQVGTSLAVTLPVQAIKSLGISVGDSVEVTLNSARGSISVTPVNVKTDTRREKITTLTLNFVDRYREDLEALAD